MTNVATNAAPKPKASVSSDDDLPVVVTIDTTLSNVNDLVTFTKKHDIEGLRITFPEED